MIHGHLRASMDVPVYIYAIESEGASEVYVGATSCLPQLRLARHICQAFDKPPRLDRNRFIRAAIEEGRPVRIAELETVAPGGDWQRSESFWIDSFRYLGISLVNQTSGGLGQKGHSFSAEHRRKIAASKLGKPRSEETKQKLRAANLGVKRGPYSAEHRKKISDALQRFHGAKVS